VWKPSKRAGACRNCAGRDEGVEVCEILKVLGLKDIGKIHEREVRAKKEGLRIPLQLLPMDLSYSQ
jgi:hypothetical protein